MTNIDGITQFIWKQTEADVVRIYQDPASFGYTVNAYKDDRGKLMTATASIGHDLTEANVRNAIDEILDQFTKPDGGVQ